MLGTRVTFPSRGKSPKARQNLRFWTPLVQSLRPFRARLRNAPGCFLPQNRPICPFELVGKSVLFFLWFHRGNTLCFQSVARRVGGALPGEGAGQLKKFTKALVFLESIIYNKNQNDLSQQSVRARGPCAPPRSARFIPSVQSFKNEQMKKRRVYYAYVEKTDC